MINKEPFEKIIAKLKDEGKYRVFNDILRERGNFPKAIWYSKYAIKNIVNWCSNDYLGMGQNKVVLDAMHTALDQTGGGSGGTRNIGGTSHYHVALEHQLAKLHKKETSLLYTSAYVANEWTLVALSRIIPDIVFLSDSKLPPEERVLKVFESKIKDVADKKLEYGCFIGKLSLEISSTEESIVPIINTLHERMREGVQQCLLENTDRDISKAEYISNIIMYTWQGALMRYSTSNDMKHFDNFLNHLKDLLLT